jgi:hypothetical protein
MTGKIRRIFSLSIGFMLALSLMSVDAIFASDSKTVSGYTLNLSGYASKWVYQEESKCYALTGVVYCSKPVDTTCESMNTYVPAVYVNANGTKDTDSAWMVSLNDYIMFKMRGGDTTLAWSWDEGHVRSDPLNTSFTAWLDGICKK